LASDQANTTDALDHAGDEIEQQDNSLSEQNDDEESEELSDGDVGGYALFDPDDTETYGTAGLILLRTPLTLIRGTEITDDERNVVFDRWTHHPHRPEPMAGFRFDMKMEVEDEEELMHSFEDDFDSETRSEAWDEN
jgi:hypothetical protein